jgi:hypothetical protein
MELIDKFKYLPDELIDIIINYTDKIAYRHGKYINRIDKKDKRYVLIKSIPKPIFIYKDQILLRLINRNNFGYFIHYNFKNEIAINIKSFYRELDGFDKYNNIQSNNTYIMNENNLVQIS